MNSPAHRDLEKLRRIRPGLVTRSRVLQAIRRFFNERSFLAVETPVRIPAPALELNIDAEPAGGWFLRTSPELHMKRLLAAGYGRIFQMGPCFRMGERGQRHHPEYTMLEWYRTGVGSDDILADTRELIRAVVSDVTGGAAGFRYQGRDIRVDRDWAVLTVEEAYQRWAGWNPVTEFDPDRFDLDMVNRIEPALPRDRPVVLTDYPAPVAALARRRPERPEVAERWELYLGGLELANAYGELTDAAEQRARFEDCAVERAGLGKAVYPLDEPFLAAMEAGLPPCGGIALGVDRLAMLLADATDIRAVRPFGDDGGA